MKGINIMVPQHIFIDEFTGQNQNLFLHSQIFDDPSLLLEGILKEINNTFAMLSDIYDVKFEQFDLFLENTCYKRNKKIKKLWEKIDCDIYDRYLQGTLLSYEFNNWKKTLFEWKTNMFEVIHKFIKMNCKKFCSSVSNDYFVQAA